MTVRELVEALQKLPPHTYGYKVRALRGIDEDGVPLVEVDEDGDYGPPVVWL
ncbi:hypothetical protein BH790_gp68 [Gordonia phage Gsput1]|uniref:Uncharacterized protein n=1 Tax=Gordonia phage Gsput1 TaxID=1622193 RepID=A0A0E3XB77_9CAUD|nr:hypothetical protein BH790_gp68 [Gordonia phage Gsput1]AKC03093.1 hypothetical protein Gsput1_68 [Gordonia phage Gsput1]